MGFYAGPNFYTYVENRATTSVDPLGLASKKFPPFRTRFCNGQESAACQATCRSQGKEMESCRVSQTFRIVRVTDQDGAFKTLREARELKPYAEPVAPADLKVGATYFSVQFVDDEMLIPELEPLVFVGRDLTPGDQGTLYFQDAGSYRQGIRFESSETDEAAFYAQREDEINHVFEYERALDLLLTCSMRRKKAHGGST